MTRRKDKGEPRDLGDNVSEEILSYFQFHQDAEIPVYVAYDERKMGDNLKNLLLSLGFSGLGLKESEQIESSLAVVQGARLLKIVPASPKVSMQIGMYVETDQFGAESSTPKGHYTVYRYRGEALMVSSQSFPIWELGVKSNFASKDKETLSRIILHRYLSLALVPHGIVGFWGEKHASGSYVSNSEESAGQAFFIDVRNHRVFRDKTGEDVTSGFTFFRVDPTLRDRNIPMRAEELLSFLTYRTTYFDFHGPSVPVRQMIQALVKWTKGLVIPQRTDNSPSDLSLP